MLHSELSFGVMVNVDQYLWATDTGQEPCREDLPPSAWVYFSGRRSGSALRCEISG